MQPSVNLDCNILLRGGKRMMKLSAGSDAVVNWKERAEHKDASVLSTINTAPSQACGGFEILRNEPQHRLNLLSGSI